MFDRLKRTKRSLPNNPVVYPIGSVVKTEKGTYYIKDAGRRYKIPSDRVLNSWSFHRIIISNEVALKNYKVVSILGFRAGSLIHNITDGKLYLVSENKLRHITSPDALDRIGAKYDDAVTVSDEDLNLHEFGEPLR